MQVRQILSSFLLAGLMAAQAYAADVRIAVAAEGVKADAAVSAMAGRAPNILIFDAKGKLLSAQPNPAAKLSGGAGPALARWLAEQKVNTLVAGQVGGNMADEMKRLNIRTVTGKGPADQAAKAATQAAAK
jgi:predicted Fe-Mo cluster-binding NifX family protein